MRIDEKKNIPFDQSEKLNAQLHVLWLTALHIIVHRDAMHVDESVVLHTAVANTDIIRLV